MGAAEKDGPRRYARLKGAGLVFLLSPKTSLVLTWPSEAKRLVKIELGGHTIFDTRLSGGTATVTQWKGHLQDRQIKAGATSELRLSFEANASATLSLYSLVCGFGGGTVTLLP